MLSLRTRTLPAIAILVAISGQAANRDRQPTAPATPSEGFVADVAQMRSALEEGDPSLYRHRTKSAVDSAFAALADSASHATSDAEFWRHLTATLAFVRDGHLTAMPSGSLWGPIVLAPLPLRLRVVGERLYVLRNLVKAATPPDGSEIVSFNGMTTPQVLSFCLQHISADGTLRTRGYRRIERDFDVACGSVLGSPKQYVIGSIAPGTNRVHVDTLASSTSRTERAAPSAAPAAPGALRFIPSGHIAVLTLHSFSKANGFDPSAFMNLAFRSIADSGVTSLIIDLRDNGGGRDGIGAELIAHIARDTFTYARRVALRRHFTFADWVTNWRIKLFISTKTLPDGRLALNESLDRPQRPARHPFAGNVIALADRGTFSTASEVMAVMQEYKRATFVGEETATGREGDSGATTGVMLTHSGILIDVPLVKYELPFAAHAPLGRGVLPDVHVEPAIEDLLAGRDVVMDAALQLARSRAR